MTGNDIRVEEVPQCPMCGSERRKTLYAGLTDRLFGAPGEWTLKECRDCGTAFLDPRLTPEDIGKAYVTYHTHSTISESPRSNLLIYRFYRALKAGYLGNRWGYSQETKPWHRLLGLLLYLLPRAKAQLDSTVMYLEAAPGERLLDVGCGSGELMDHMQDLGWRVEGVDFDAMAVQAAQKRGLRVRLGTLEQQSYPDDSFKAITVSHVIEHVHDPLALLRECHRILKPGGRLVMITPNISSIGHKRFGAYWRGLEPPRHLQIFAPVSLQRFAKRAGFKKLSVHTSIRSTSWIYVRSRLLSCMGFYSDREPIPLPTRLWGLVMQHLAWLMLQRLPDVGEEIILTCEKQ